MPAPDGRSLSAGEIGLASGMFGDAIDYSAVRIFDRSWWPFQPRNYVMAPDGNLWLHPRGALAEIDFSTASLAIRGLFIHEMTHVWQHQQGLCLIARRHPFCRYGYRLQPGKSFERYGIEQQAEIVRDVWLLRRGFTKAGKAPLEAYDALLPFGRG